MKRHASPVSTAPPAPTHHASTSNRLKAAWRRRCLGALMLGSLSLMALPAAGQDAQADKKPFKVITSFTIIADMARQVAGEAAVVESITKPGAEIHDYQPTPGDLVRAQGAQLILWNGMNLERWFEKFFKRLKRVPSAIVTEGITPIPITDGPYAGKPNPHAWMSPTLAATYVDNIERALSEHDPANASTYKANAQAYKQQIAETIEPIKARLAQVPDEKRWLVSSEGAFSYLAKDVGLKELYLWPINADQQGTPQQVRQVIDTMRARKIPVIFSESTVSAAPAQQIARETGARYGGVLYVDSLSTAEGKVPTYLDLLRVTTETVAQALTSP
ncbi:MAG: metal ABC transporter substrate-binding protein [Lautropia sp.]|nr:metal ABC transporter substrate-binding protein [Lautropia sp.]